VIRLGNNCTSLNFLIRLSLAVFSKEDLTIAVTNDDMKKAVRK